MRGIAPRCSRRWAPPTKVAAVAAALSERRAEEVEAAVTVAGGVAGAVRSLDAWRCHSQGRAVAGEPLIGHRSAGDAAPRIRPPAELPASGVRVLDLTRVIAGPVCTRFLGALGADVLRLDPPHHPDLRVGEVADTLLGKSSAMLDLGSRIGAATLHGLLAQADVVVCGYRPGSLDRFGLKEEVLSDRHPGVVVVYIDAWGHGGPWVARRGFHSIVQAATGIRRRGVRGRRRTRRDALPTPRPRHWLPGGRGRTRRTPPPSRPRRHSRSPCVARQDRLMAHVVARITEAQRSAR